MPEQNDPTRKYYKYIVVGCGGVGSAALYWLSKKTGKDVLGLEQFELGHDNGGSQDHSRIIRLAYVDERYAKLAPDAYKAWHDVEEESGIKLVHKTGGVQYGKKFAIEELFNKYAKIMEDSNIRYIGDVLSMNIPKFSDSLEIIYPNELEIKDTTESACSACYLDLLLGYESEGKHCTKLYDKYEKWSGSQLNKKFPQFQTDDSYIALYQPDAGLVAAALGNSVHVQLARAHGATIMEQCQVLQINRAATGRIQVHTQKGIFQCERLVVTPGAWINNVLSSIGVHIPVYITQEQVTYFATPNIRDFTMERFPIWRYQSDGDGIYGMPIYGNSGTKVGIDCGGPLVTPETRNYKPDSVRERLSIEHLKNTIPRAVGPKLYTKTCLYTMPPDRHFVIDTCASRGWDDVIICCGAGHIYKFSGIVGKILSELAVDGKTKYDISKFNLDRDALTVPGWKPVLYKDTGGRLPKSAQGVVLDYKSKL